MRTKLVRPGVRKPQQEGTDFLPKEKNELVEQSKEDLELNDKHEGNHANHHDFLRRYFLQTDTYDKKLPFEILTKSLG